ncbi:MAG: hypothetical protein DCC71_03665 [Proteobacteria bacterium]|nr:MAG: hypothetical protein DCC71_03665 [Pseudomonadota bacterium]
MAGAGAMKRRVRSLAPALAVSLLAAGASGCFQNAYEARCTPDAGAIAIAWTPDPAYRRHRVYRVTRGGALAPVAEVDGAQWRDADVVAGAEYHYVIRPLDDAGAEQDDAGGVGACSATAQADASGGPDAVGDLTCRAKSGKVDLAWSAVPDAVSYRVLRAPAASDFALLAEIAAPPYADLGAVDGAQYAYAVVAVDAAGATSEPSAACTATPGPRGDGEPPDAVADLACRGKRDKVDLTWTAVADAAFYRVYRDVDGAVALAGEVTGAAFADFGVVANALHQYRVRAVAADGTASADSAACSYAATDRDGGNAPPQITSTPLTSALEGHVYAYEVVAVDPEGGPVAFSTAAAPVGMFFEDGTSRLFWIPTAAQIGPQSVELRATDAAGAFASQAFVVTAADFNEPPRITSVPGLRAQVGEAYAYDADAFDPEGAALAFSFAEPAPPGMAIDPATGVVTWTPGAPLLGRRIAVRATDAGGAFDDQVFSLDATQDPLVLTAPEGEFQIEVGQTLELRFASNYPNARYSAFPLPANATQQRDLLRFAPQPGQAGRYELVAKGLLNGLYDTNRVAITVIDPNAPPAFGALGPFEIAEGETLRVPVAASDPDGDALALRAPGLALDNAFFDEFSGTLVFQPSFEQAGAYEVVIEASDGTAAVQTRVAITVTDAEPPVGALELVVDPPQSPTFVRSQTITGSVIGEVVSVAAAAAPLVTGLAPTNVQQGRPATIAITGRNTEFVQGETTATFGDGVAVDAVVVTSPTSATAHVSVSPTAPIGIRQMRVRSGGQEIPSVVAFRVEAGAAIVRGRLTDSFTGEPIANARIQVNGSDASAITGADGSFEIHGVPSGAQTLVAVVPNFEALQLPIQVEENSTYQLDEPVGLDALARPARPGGSLPRAQTLASIVDRGISTVDQPMSQEQAELLISDTLIAVGVDQLGVVDEAGRQLNPRIAGHGMLSLSPAAVRFFADRLVRGDTYTLGQLLFYLEGSFGWIFEGIDVESQIERLQLSVQDAWANASNPEYALVIALFNPGGTTLSSQPPVLSSDTLLNSFQGFLLVTSFMARTFPVLDMAFDQKLRDRGIDPRDVLRANGVDVELYGGLDPHERPGGGAVTQLAARAAGWLGMAGDLAFGAPAHAQTPPPPGPPSTWQRMRGGVANVFSMPTLTSAFVSGAVNVVFAVAIAGLLAVCGIAAPAAALSVVGLFLFGFLTTIFAKLIGGFLADPHLPERYAPAPPAIISQVAPDLDDPNFYLRFRRAEGDIRSDAERRLNPDIRTPLVGDVSAWVQDGFDYLDGRIDTRLLEYRYALWRLPCNPDDPTCRANLGTSLRGREPIARDSFLAPLSASELDSEPLIPAPGFPVDAKRGHAGEFEQFRVPKRRLTNGANFFQIQTLQFYRRIWNGVDPDDDSIEIPFPDVGIEQDELPYEGAPSTGLGAVDAFRGNGLQETGKLVRRGLGIPFQQLVLEEQADQIELQRLAAAQAAAEDRLHRANAMLMRVGTHSAPVELAEARVKQQLEQLRARVAPAAGGFRSHDTLVRVLDRRLSEQGATLANANELYDELVNGNSRTSTLVRVSLSRSQTGTGEFNRYIAARLGEHRIGLGIARHNDAIAALRELRMNLSLAYRAAPQTPEFPSFNFSGSVDTLPGRLQIDGAVVARSQTPRVPFAISETIESVQQLDAVFARIDAEIAAQQTEIRRLTDVRSGNTGTWRAEFEARTRTFKDAFYDSSLYADDLAEFELAKQRLKVSQEMAVLQKQASDAEVRHATMKRGLGSVAPNTPRGFRAGLTEAAAQRKALVATEGHIKGIKGSFGVNTANVIGVAVEVGNEVHGLRAGLDLVTSPLSATIVVNATRTTDPATGREQIAVTSAPAATAASVGLPEVVPIASRFGDDAPEPALPQYADLLARGPLARLAQLPMAIDDAGRPFGARRAPAAQRVQFTGPAGRPIQFESDPDPLNMLAVLYPAGPPPENPRDGFLFRDFPFSPHPAERYGAGFPSELIAVDADGAVYLQNYNSNEQFGGRIFRYAGEPPVREHIGSVNYFSQTLMYGHPASPVAMEIGDVTTQDYGVVEDLFVANRDLGVYFDASRPAVHRVLRVPIHLADRVPAYRNGQNRNRLVGQPWAEHPDFRFDGPTDLEVDARGAASFAHGERPLYLSDMDSLYVLRDTDHDGSAEVTKLAQVAGRTFSGIASDQSGNLFVADFAAGDVYLIPQQILDDIAAGAAPMLASDDDLDRRAFLIKVELDRPGDIELDTYQHRYIVSTPAGLEPFDVPAVGRLPDDVVEIRVDAIGSELPVTLRRGNAFTIGANSEGTFAGKEVRIRARRVDGATGQSIWKAHLVRTQTFGASVLRDDALELP